MAYSDVSNLIGEMSKHVSQEIKDRVDAETKREKLYKMIGMGKDDAK